MPTSALSSPQDPMLVPELVGQVDAFIVDLVATLDPAVVDPPSTGPGRPRVLPGLMLWTGVLLCVLHRWTHQRDLWRLLCFHGVPTFPRFALSDEAIYRRLAQAGPAPLAQLCDQVSAVLADRLAAWPVLGAADLAPFARDVVAIDETTLDPVARSLPHLRGQPTEDLLPGKLAGIFDLRTQQWRTIQYHPDPHQNERVAARDLVATLRPGTLILADLGYFGFAWFDDLTDAGHFWLSRLRGKTSYTVIHTHYQQGETLDALVWLGAYRADKAKHAVRLIQFRVKGTLHRYVTNVRDPRQLTLGDCARLYARRWDIELAVSLIKRELGLHLLWSATPAVMLQQVWAVLIIAQIVQALRLEVAGRAGVDPFDVSMPLLVAAVPRLIAAGEDPIAVLVARGRQVEIIRPSRRTRIVAPEMPRAALAMPPPGLVLVREPRYAQRKCGRRAAA